MNAFRQQMIALANGASRGSYLDKLHALVRSSPTECRVFSESFRNHLIERAKNTTDGASESIHIPGYAGNNRYVHEMRRILENTLKNDLLAAIVHGSLGTYEEIPYSDFDVLAIIRNKSLSNPKIAARVFASLASASRIMYRYDILQHHGWFILSEADLQVYPETYFPQALYRHSKSLLGPLTLTIKRTDESFEREFLQHFQQLAQNIEQSIEGTFYLKNLYHFKSMLSKAMLLPAFYLQARDGKSVFKRESFDRARVDFSPRHWSIMDHISQIRINWQRPQPTVLENIMTTPNRIGAWTRKHFARPIPDHLKNHFRADDADRLSVLVNMMNRQLIKAA